VPCELSDAAESAPWTVVRGSTTAPGKSRREFDGPITIDFTMVRYALRRRYQKPMSPTMPKLTVLGGGDARYQPEASVLKLRDFVARLSRAEPSACSCSRLMRANPRFVDQFHDIANPKLALPVSVGYPTPFPPTTTSPGGNRE
jgi:hypothetical protein